jgi:hypothetical protein
MTEREEILHAAAEVVATAWLADEIRAAAYNTKPNSYRVYVVATDALCRFYENGFDHQERHRIVYELAPAMLDQMRDEHNRFDEALA